MDFNAEKPVSQMPLAYEISQAMKELLGSHFHFKTEYNDKNLLQRIAQFRERLGDKFFGRASSLGEARCREANLKMIWDMANESEEYRLQLSAKPEEWEPLLLADMLDRDISARWPFVHRILLQFDVCLTFDEDANKCDAEFQVQLLDDAIYRALMEEAEEATLEALKERFRHLSM